MRYSFYVASYCFLGILMAAPGHTVEPGLPDMPIEARDVPGIEFSQRLSRHAWPVDVRPFRGAIAAFYAARGNTPLWTEGQEFSARARQIMGEIALADDWGLRTSDYRLPEGGAQDAEGLFAAEMALTAVIVKYARDARGGRYDPNRLSLNIDRKAPLLPADKVLDRLATADDPAAALRGLHPQHPQFEKLRQLYVKWKDATPQDVAADLGIALPSSEDAAQQPTTKSKKAKRIAEARKQETDPRRLRARLLYNMEMWRWMPESLGTYHIVANIPEFMFRIVKSDAVVHEERIIVGKPQTQTPNFSDEMSLVVFNPLWGVPDGIKVRDLLPGLARGANPVARKGLRMKYNGRYVEPTAIDWSSADIRNFQIYQPPGSDNALGVVKFMFPNKHQVYMHDTPTKNLFNTAVRAHSAGCVRVRDPLRFAELLLADDKDWGSDKVKSVLRTGGEDNSVKLDRKVPVHLTYFTAVVGKDGKPTFHRDIYGHEPLIQMGIDGRANQIVLQKPKLDELVGISRGKARSNSGGWNWGGGGGGGFFASAPASQSSGDRSWVRNAFNQD